ncbi:MAG: class D sortase [Patescibacteria group bacterium]|jgi:sortase A
MSRITDKISNCRLNKCWKKVSRKKRFLIVVSLIIILTILVIFSWSFFRTERSKEVSDTANQSQTVSDTVAAEDQSKFVLTIPKINITAPVIEGVDPTNKEIYNQKLQNGVALMAGSPLPGDKGNIFIYGHSSATVASKYDKIFAKLNDLKQADQLTIRHNDKEYNYSVTAKKIVEPTDLSVLEPTKDETLTLMTCWPVGTNEKRLVVISKRK